MTALPNRFCALLALALALPFDAGAAEREAPNGIPIVPKAIVRAVPKTPDPDISQPTAPSAEALDAAPAALAAPAGIPETATLAPQDQPSAEEAFPNRAARTQRVLEQLSPDNAPALGDEQASALAGQLLDPSGTPAGGGAVAAGASPSSPESRLAPWKQSQQERLGSVPADGRQAPGAEPRATIAERIHYERLWFENLWFYIYTNIRNKWGPYIGYWRKMRDSGIPPAVSRPREFFAHMRVFGQTGFFYVPGFGPVEDADVLSEARRTFAKFFDGPGITDKERAAFDDFIDRALLFNNKRRAASKFRANVRDNMLKASTMMPDKIAPFFDGLPVIAKTDEFQNNGIADGIRDRFTQTVLEAVAEEPKDAPDRITGVILIGSFALGAATPKSDFDVEPLTADGGSGRVRAFADKVVARWASAGRQQANPVTFHYFGYLNSRWEIRAIHHEPYLVISPDQAIVDNLAMRPSEPPSHTPSRKLTPAGRFLRGLQYAAVYATSLITPAKYPDKL